MAEVPESQDASESLGNVRDDVEEIKRILLKNRKDLEISDIRDLLHKLTRATEDLVKWEEKNKHNIEEVKRAVSDIGRRMGVFSLAAGAIVLLLLIIALKV